MKNGKGNGNDATNGNDENHQSHSSQKSHQPEPPFPNRVLPPRGDYQTLLSFQKAEVVYDITFRFAPQVSLQGRSHGRSDDSVGSFGQAEHSGG